MSDRQPRPALTTMSLDEPDTGRLGGLKRRIWALPGARWAIVHLLYGAAYVWRRICFKTQVIAITGSLGKTTCKQILTYILAQRQTVASTRHNQNDSFGVPRTLLRLRPWHRFAVVEVGVSAPGQMRKLARLVRPDIAIFLCVKATHSVNFRDLDQHAVEKALLLEGLKPGGWCVANADDPRVGAIARDFPGKRVFFGTRPGLDFRADEARAAWPGRLSFRLHIGDNTLSVRTQLVGLHWMPSVISALAAASIAGMSVEEAVRALRNVEPFPGRLRPMRLESGAVALRDDYNANQSALEAAVAALNNAAASRRILVISDFSDFGKNRKQRLKFLASTAAPSVDACVLIGPEADYGKRRLIEAGLTEDSVFPFERWEDAAGFLKEELKSGDVALLKGRTTDHLARLYFALLGSTGCRKERCDRTVLCDFCPQLGAVLAQHAQLVPAPAEALMGADHGP